MLFYVGSNNNLCWMLFVTEVPVLGVTEAELFLPPDLNIKYLSLRNQGMAADDPGDLGIYWRINYDRFHQDIR